MVGGVGEPIIKDDIIYQDELVFTSKSLPQQQFFPIPKSSPPYDNSVEYGKNLLVIHLN